MLGKIPEKEIPHKITIISFGIIFPWNLTSQWSSQHVPSFPILIWWSCSTINPQSPWNPKQIRKLWCLFTYEFPSHAWIWWFASGTSKNEHSFPMSFPLIILIDSLTFPLGTPRLSEFQKPTWNLVKSSPGISTITPFFPVIPMDFQYNPYIYIGLIREKTSPKWP